jgi:hypothetical protein
MTMIDNLLNHLNSTLTDSFSDSFGFLIFNFVLSLFIVSQLTKKTARLLYKGKQTFHEAHGVHLTQRSFRNKSWHDLFVIDCSSAIFSISRKSSLDNFLNKTISLNRLQTGDHHFDDKIQVESDHFYFNELIKKDINTRNIITSLIDLGCKSIICDGNKIYAHFTGLIKEENSIHDLLARFYLQLQQIRPSSEVKIADPYFKRIRLIEIFNFLIALYGFMSIIYFYFKHDGYLNLSEFISHGFIFAGLFFLMIPTIIYLALKKSARFKQVMTENLILMILTFPCAGFSFAHHFNKFIDYKPYLVIEAKVEDLNFIKLQKQSKKGPYEEYLYYMFLKTNQNFSNINIPQKMQINYETYNSIKKNDILEMTIAQGGLNHPWFKNKRFKRPLPP